MTPADLSRLESLAREATQGKWDAQHGLKLAVWAGPAIICAMDNSPQAKHNAAYIAAVNPAAVLALIARVRELEAANADPG